MEEERTRRHFGPMNAIGIDQETRRRSGHLRREMIADASLKSKCVARRKAAARSRRD
jgi:hypothetical protein